MAQEMTISRPTGRPCARAARTLPPVMRAAKPNVVRFISTQSSDGERRCRRRGPNARRVPGMVADHVGVADRRVDGLLGLAGIAQRALDEEVHDRDGDVGQQQAGDGLVDAAIVAQHADEADPDGAGQRRGDDHHRHDEPAASAQPMKRDGDRRRGEAAEHQRALAADDDQAEPRRDRDAERGEDQRRRRAPACSATRTACRSRRPEEREELDRRLAEDEQEDREEHRRDEDRERPG